MNHHFFKSQITVFLIAFIVLASGCSKNRKDLFASKRYKQTVQERDELKAEVNNLKLSYQDSLVALLNSSLINALPGFNSDELTVMSKDGKVYVSMNDKLLFKSASASVEEKGREALKKVANVLNSYPGIDILVEGHTDNLPIKTTQYKDNWDLSAARAISIVRILNQEYKIPGSRLSASGKSEYHPVSSNASPDGRARNRRTEIILSPKSTLSSDIFTTPNNQGK